MFIVEFTTIELVENVGRLTVDIVDFIVDIISSFAELDEDDIIDVKDGKGCVKSTAARLLLSTGEILNIDDDEGVVVVLIWFAFEFVAVIFIVEFFVCVVVFGVVVVVVLIPKSIKKEIYKA